MDSIWLRRYLPSILLVVGIALVLSAQAQRAVPLAGSLTSVLPAFGGLRVTEQVVSDEERKVAGMSDYVARMYYKDSSVAFTTYVGYYDRQAQGKTIHSPRNCLPGAGWEVLAGDTASITAAGRRHLVNRFTLKNGPIQAVVLYWYQGRGRVVANEYAVKWNLLRDAALERHTEEALVRIVVFVRPPESKAAIVSTSLAEADALGRSVATQLLTDVERVLPPRDGAATASKSTPPIAVAAR